MHLSYFFSNYFPFGQNVRTQSSFIFPGALVRLVFTFKAHSLNFGSTAENRRCTTQICKYRSSEQRKREKQVFLLFTACKWTLYILYIQTTFLTFIVVLITHSASYHPASNYTICIYPSYISVNDLYYLLKPLHFPRMY